MTYKVNSNSTAFWGLSITHKWIKETILACFINYFHNNKISPTSDTEVKPVTGHTDRSGFPSLWNFTRVFIYMCSTAFHVHKVPKSLTCTKLWVSTSAAEVFVLDTFNTKDDSLWSEKVGDLGWRDVREGRKGSLLRVRALRSSLCWELWREPSYDHQKLSLQLTLRRLLWGGVLRCCRFEVAQA